MYQNKLQLLMINIAEHFLTFGDIKSNKINSKHTDISPRFLCPPCWDFGNSSYRHQWFRCEYAYWKYLEIIRVGVYGYITKF